MTCEFKFNLGDRVRLAELNQPGIVEGLSVDGLGKQCRVVYWWNGERRTVWVYEQELQKAEPETV